MIRAKRLLGVFLVTALLAALALGTSAIAQQSSMEVNLTESRNSGVTGDATLRDVEGGVEVTLNVRGLPEAGVEHINHIHGGGTCGDDRADNPAPVTLPLTTITAEEDGTGSATTILEDVTVDELRDPTRQQRYVAFHTEQGPGGGVPDVISCADLTTTTSGGQAKAVESTVAEPLPQSGGVFPSVLLPTIALLLGSGVLVLAVVRRR
jgi:CHRD domain-containing protein